MCYRIIKTITYETVAFTIEHQSISAQLYTSSSSNQHENIGLITLITLKTHFYYSRQKNIIANNYDSK